MDAVRPERHHKIHPIIDQQSGAMAARQTEHLLSQQEQGTRREVPFPELHRAQTCCDGFAKQRDEGPPAGLTPIGDQVEGKIYAGHDP
jgi:hypothetical protein